MFPPPSHRGPPSTVRATAELVEPRNGAPEDEALRKFLESPRFRERRYAVDRFLALLSWLYLTHSIRFAKAAFSFRGRKRVYFSRSKKEILRSGESLAARAIPQSPYWALITISNDYKRVILEHILQTLGYSPAEIDSALAALPKAIWDLATMAQSAAEGVNWLCNL